MADDRAPSPKLEPCGEHGLLLVPPGDEAIASGTSATPQPSRAPSPASSLRERAAASRNPSRAGSREPSPTSRAASQSGDRVLMSLQLKASTQASRVTMLEHLLATARGSLAGDYTLTQLETTVKQAEHIWAKFASVHDVITDGCIPEFLESPYFKDDLYLQAFTVYQQVTSLLARFRDELQPRTAEPAASGRTAAIGRENLPKISLPTFTGDFATWISFRDLFTSLVRDNAALTDVERMHYLRTATSGEAGKLIGSLPIEADSFAPAWETLCERYNHTRVLLRSHLDSLFRTTVIAANSAKDLRTLIHDVSEAYNSLRVLGAPIEHWDWVLEYAITRRLDTSSRVAWETKAGQFPNQPKLSELRAFLTNRARALEGSAVTTGSSPSRNGSNNTGSSRTSSGPVARPPARALAASSGSKYTCSMCNQGHFIISCPKFRELTNEQRREKAQSLRLCFNCLGRHNVAACQTTTTCKECQRKHHTMIHTGWSRDGGTPSSASASGSAGGPSGTPTPGPSSSGNNA